MTTSNILEILRKQKKVSLVLLVTVLLWSLGLPLWINTVNAASVTSFSDTLSDSDTSVVSNHTIQFTTSSTGELAAGEALTITLESGFVIPDLLDHTDLDMKVATVEQTLAGAASGPTWGVSIATTTRVITITSGTSTIATGTTVEIEIGTHATTGATGDQQITNPGTAKSYTIDVTVASADSGQTRVAIIDDVAVTASVDTIFTFNIYGVNASTSVITSESLATSATTTATSMPFGTLEGGVPKLLAQKLTVTTNAKNGFSVTLFQNQNLLSASTADIDTFVDGDATSTPQSWVSPTATPGDEWTYGHYGITSEDNELTGSQDPFGNALYVGQFSSANPLEVFWHNDVSNGSGVGEGETYVAVKIETTSLQEAASDYNNTLTYIATPIF